MMHGSPYISLVGIERDFPGEQGTFVKALVGISLRVFGGEMVCLLGPSGAGKTTLLNLLACLDKPNRGKYELFGLDAVGASEKERANFRNRRLGLLHRGAKLVNHLSLAHNVELPLEYGGGKRYRVRAKDALAEAGIAGIAHLRPVDISPGEARLASVARALVMNPQVVLADEPAEGLDRRSALKILALLQRANTNKNTTVLIATKNAEVATLCTRVISLDGGRVTRDEPVHDRRLAAAILASPRQP